MSFSSIPDYEHYALIESSSIHIPGDERSRTNPGHGYPDHTVENITYTAFETKEELEDVIKYRSRLSPSSYKIMHVVPLTVTRTISID